jgi:uncharacterized membrane protein YgdD (TMEM256/DUF423 family)
MDQRKTLITASIIGALAVALGAFGAHALKGMLEASDRVDVYKTAVSYHFYHTFALLAVGILMNQFPSAKLRYASIFFLTGIILFSGSLYVLCFTGIGILGAITPVGGVLFIFGWVFLTLGFSKEK